MKRLLLILLLLPVSVWGATATLTLKSNLADVDVALSGTSASGGAMTVTQGEIVITSTNTTRTFRVALYDGNRNYLDESSTITTVNGAATYTFNFPETQLVAEGTYFIVFNNYSFIDVATTTASNQLRGVNAYGSIDPLPDPLPTGDARAQGNMAIRLLNSNNDVILGPSSFTDYSSYLNASPDEVRWKTTGIEVNSL